MIKKPRISIVVAVTRKNAAIGNGGKLLVRISDDLKRFKVLTLGHPVIMGRKTFESIGKPLPERTNVVITRNPDFRAEGVFVVNSLEEALQKASALESQSPFAKGAALGGCSEKGVPESARAGVVTPLLPKTAVLPLLGEITLPQSEFAVYDYSSTPFAKGDFPNPEIFIIGGGEIYAQALPFADKLYLTIVDSDAEGDVFFPDWRKDFTKETFRDERFDEKTGLRYTWIDLERS